MGFMATIKAQQAMRAHGKGDLEQAKKLYEEAIDKGLMSARPMLGYAILLIREGSYDKAMPLLIKAQKCPDLTPDQKSQLFVDYAACLMKKGELDKAIHLLEKQHNRPDLSDTGIHVRREVFGRKAGCGSCTGESRRSAGNARHGSIHRSSGRAAEGQNAGGH